jgi:hypothetical protein
MKVNEGTIDRVLRAVVGLVLIGLAYNGTFVGVWLWIGGVIGAVLLLTGLVGICPAYAIFGISTCPMKKS